MKTKLTLIFICCLLSTLGFSAFAQGTAFTYQGQLNDSGQPANGNYDLRFSLFTTNSGGSLAFGFATNSGVAVSNGLFTVTIDFGSNVFGGTTYWLQIGVRTNGAASFTSVSPRQQLTPAPYSIFAENVNAGGINGTIPTGNVGGTYGNAVNFNNGANSFDGSFYGDFYGATFTGGNFVGNFVGTGSSLTDIWHTEGNFGTTAGTDFVGTTDNQPLEFHVNNLRAMRLEPTANTPNVAGAVNVVGGASVNCAASGVQGATIAGGGAPYYFGGGTSNRVASTFDTIGGGVNNDIEINSYEATIGGGNANSILPGAYRSTISGGWNNTIETNAFESFIGGGINNVIQTNAGSSTIAGGLNNSIQANGVISTIGGGFFNTIQMAAGAAFIGGGGFNQIFGNFRGAGYSVIGGGYNNSILTNADYSVIGGGLNNQVFGDTNDFGTGVVAGGDANVINNNSWNSFIGGGQGNSIGSSSDHTVIVGGIQNVATAIGAFIGGGGTDGTITEGNAAFGNASSIAGGMGNTIQLGSPYSVIGGGRLNIIQTNNQGSAIGGGYGNTIQSSQGPVFLIAANTIAGGAGNTILTNALDATVAGGSANGIGNNFASIGGGALNTNNAGYGTIPGGYLNLTGGNYSFAAGSHAQALYSGDFVWADSQNTNFTSTTTDQVSFRCQGGVRFTSGSGTANQTVAWTPGTGSWTFTSDRNAKENFEPVDVRAVLEKVAHLPLTEWNYKGYADRHIGPMAQDFHTAFPFNANDKMLNSADEAGVELAAIQGINRKVEAEKLDSETRIRKLEAENAELKQRLEVLERAFLEQQAKE